MPKMTYQAPGLDRVVQKDIRDSLRLLVRQGIADDDVLERIQQQLATINEDDNLKPHERRY